VTAVAATARTAAAPSIRGEAELSVYNLSKRFAGGADVLTDVSFRVEKGETVALLGANGAGKSTLLRCCLRLIEPDAGRISVLGSDPCALRPAELRRLRARVGFVFQRHNLVPRLAALSNVMHGALARGGGMRAWCHQLAPRVLRTEAMDCLDRVGLADFAERRADQLSGGQSQRVAVARALMQRAEMLFADEPVASLDPAAGEEVMRLFRELVRSAGLTLVFTTHNLRHALDYADRIVALRAGRVEIDAPAQALDHGALRAFYG
jgi:phosphonate transport system ATP-binding protein